MTETATTDRAEFREGGQERSDRLAAALEPLSSEQRLTVTAHLLGGLMCYVDDETWDQLVESSVRFEERHR